MTARFPTFSEALEKCDHWASMYFRLRDSLATTGTPDRCRCISCRKIVPAEKTQNGHYYDRECKALRYHPKNNNGQCDDCNGDRVHKGLVHESYGHGLVRKYGEGVKDELWEAKKTPRLYSAPELIALAKDFHRKYNDLRRTHYLPTK